MSNDEFTQGSMFRITEVLTIFLLPLAHDLRGVQKPMLHVF